MKPKPPRRRKRRKRDAPAAAESHPARGRGGSAAQSCRDHRGRTATGTRAAGTSRARSEADRRRHQPGARPGSEPVGTGAFTPGGNTDKARLARGNRASHAYGGGTTRRRRATASRPLERERGRSAAQGRRSHRRRTSAGAATARGSRARGGENRRRRPPRAHTARGGARPRAFGLGGDANEALRLLDRCARGGRDCHRDERGGRERPGPRRGSGRENVNRRTPLGRSSRPLRGRKAPDSTWHGGPTGSSRGTASCARAPGASKSCSGVPSSMIPPSSIITTRSARPRGRSPSRA